MHNEKVLLTRCSPLGLGLKGNNGLGRENCRTTAKGVATCQVLYPWQTTKHESQLVLVTHEEE